jgi:two-component system sensor histidine kinase/response regulator
METDLKYKILIIDDEEIVLDSCSMLLSGKGYQVLIASRGTEGLKLIETEHPDLVFVDLKMPGISGFEVLERAREIDPNIVTIVITGFATVDSAVEAMKNGAYDFLPKPFTPDEFRLILQRGLDRRKLILETIRLKKEKDLLRDQFAAIVSHELKSPLGAVQQNLYVLEAELADTLNPDQNERLQRMKTKIDDLIQLIHTWLRVISIDINQLRASFKPLLVSELLGKAIESIQPHATRKDIAIENTLEQTGLKVNGDEGTLVESIVNILGNAVKYSRNGSVITLNTSLMDDEVLISIKDNGVGIADEDLPLIFDDFYTGEVGDVAPKSSGLGLAITRRIVEAHDGHISVTSKLGKGSTFTIHLPKI